MAIKYGKGLRGALGRMPNVGYEYVPLPYKEMLTGNLMRQAAYDKGQETIDNIDSLYDKPVLSEDQDILQAQEDQFDSDLKEQMDAVGGDLGKLTGFLSSRFKQAASNTTYRNALQSKVAYDKYYTELMEADIDPQIKQLKMRQSKANYLGADKGIFKGASYIDMNQIDFDKRMREIANAVPLTKTTRQVEVLVNTKTGRKYTKSDDIGYYTLKKDGSKDYATNANSKVVPQEITTEQRDPKQLAILLNNAINRSGIDSAYVRDLVQAQIPDRQITPEDIQNFIYSEKVDAEGNPYLDGLASQFAYESKVSNYDEGEYDFETEPTEGPEVPFTSPDEMIGYYVGDSPSQTIIQQTASNLGGQVLEFDPQIKELETRIAANPNASENEIATNQHALDAMINERNSLLKQAVDSSEEQINAYAESSILWSDDVFDTNMKNYYSTMKGDIKNLTGEKKTQEEFTDKAKLLAAIPGIESIPLLLDSPGAIEALMGLNTANYKLLEKSESTPNGFEKDESIMPYLQAAKWIANRARRAGIVSSYEQSLRSVSNPDSNSYIATLSGGLTDMMVNQQLAYTDFYANEDIKATTLEEGVNKELVQILPTLTMMNGSPAYQFNEYEKTKSSVTADIKRGKLIKTTFVKGTNTEDEAVRYMNLGVHLLKLGASQQDTPAGLAHMNDGTQVIANSIILGPMQRTGLETAGMVGKNKDADGFPYMEKKLSGHNVTLRRVDKGGGISIFELRSSKSGKLIGYDDPNTAQYNEKGENTNRQALVGASLQDLALKYFLLSGESINNSGMTGSQLLNSYIKPGK